LEHILVQENELDKQMEQELKKSTIERGTYVSKIGNKKTCMLYYHNTNLAGEGVTKAKIVPSFWETGEEQHLRSIELRKRIGIVNQHCFISLS